MRTCCAKQWVNCSTLSRNCEITLLIFCVSMKILVRGCSLWHDYGEESGLSLSKKFLNKTKKYGNQCSLNLRTSESTQEPALFSIGSLALRAVASASTQELALCSIVSLALQTPTSFLEPALCSIVSLTLYGRRALEQSESSALGERGWSSTVVSFSRVL